MGFLILFLVVGIVASLIMPRLFVGDIVIVPMRNEVNAALLGPIQSNFTQSGYVTLSVLSALAVILLVDESRFRDTLLLGFLAGGIVCIVSGLVDIATAYTGTQGLLAPFRSAEYAFLTSSDVAGIRRVVGFAPEASSYGTICVEFAASVTLLRTLYAKGRQRIVATVVVVGLIIMAVLSTSSTAYIGLAVLGLVYAANLVRRAFSSLRLDQGILVWELLVALFLIIALLFISLLRADLFDPLVNVIDESVFHKSQSASFYERSLWNSTAWEAFFSSWGLGVGFGSTRTSNWFAAVISNTGLLGATLMGIFLVQSLLRRPRSRTLFSMELMAALKLSLLPALAMYGVASPGADFGLWMAVVFGAIAGVAAFRAERDSPARMPADAVRARPGRRRPARALGGFVPAPPQESGPETPSPRPSF